MGPEGKILKMAVHYRTQGFFIKKTDRGEADQLFTIYTKDFGKLEILGKAIRKIRSKLRGGAELFYLSEIEFIQGKTHKTLTDAILIENFPNIKKDLKRLTTAFKISETLDSLVRGQEPDKDIWQLLNETFERINSEKSEIIYYYFLWNLLSILGYGPQLYNCAFCQRKLIPGKLYFSFEDGGVVCPVCSARVKKIQKINPDIIKILRIILKKDWEILSKLKIEPPHRKLLKEVSESYLNGIIREYEK